MDSSFKLLFVATNCVFILLEIAASSLTIDPTPTISSTRSIISSTHLTIASTPLTNASTQGFYRTDDLRSTVDKLQNDTEERFAKLEQDFNMKLSTIEQKLNISIEEKDNLTQALNQEKSTRTYLQRINEQLNQTVSNLSAEYAAVISQVADIKASTMDLENRLNNLTDGIVHMKNWTGIKVYS